ncbi:MAG: preprotein translocase subunit YajC [Bacteroidales bacterium]|nr:preprotein translocase subunit YajC [Bacteroidales bacterium]
MNLLSSILLMAAPQEGAQGGGYQQIIFLVLIIAVFYFFMIRPQMKRQKEIKKFRESLQKGDKVMTTGGIYGKVNDIKDDFIQVEIAPNVVIKVDKTSVVRDMADLNTKK